MNKLCLDLLSRLKDRKINIHYVDGNLKVQAPPGTLTPGLISEIKENKALLIEALPGIEKKNRYSSINPLEKKDYYELSSAQKRLYIIWEMDPGRTGYNMTEKIDLGKQVDRNRLGNTFHRLIRRHESLRTSFETVNEKPVQRIHGRVDFAIEYHDLTGDEEIGKSKSKIENSFVRPFDLAGAPLLRVCLITAGERNTLLVDMHHIIFDGTSQAVLKQEFSDIYDNGADLSRLRLQYKDYSEWQNSSEQQEAVKKQEAYWLNEFSGDLPVLNLPLDFPRPVLQSFAGAGIDFYLSENETLVLKDICRQNDVTLFILLNAAINILLSRLSGQEDIIIGTPAAGRGHADLKNIIGMFVNTLALRNFVGEEKSFVSFLKEVKESTLSAFENQDYQFEDVVEKLALQRDMSRNPVFDVMLNLPQMAEFEGEVPGDAGQLIYRASGVSLFDLAITAVETGKKLFISFAYCKKLFKVDTIKRFTGYFKTIISSVAANPAGALSDIEFITAAEKEQVLYEFNRAESGAGAAGAIVHRLAEQVRKTPDRAAACFEDTILTYGELNERANRLAGLLRRKGVKGDTIVGILLDKSLEMVISLLGVLKAGGAYLPMETDLPEKRIVDMLDTADVPVLLTGTAAARDFSLTALQGAGTIRPLLTGSRSRINDMDTLPLPDRSLIDYEKYNRYIGYAGVKHSISLEGTRGCPYNCSYCHKIFPKKQVGRSAENIFEEVRYYYNLGVRRFSIIDDIFNLQIENSSRFYDLIIKNELDVQLFFSAGIRGDILTRDYIDLMVRAGTVCLAPALETASPRLQKLIGKNLKIDKLRDNLEYICKKYPEVILELFMMHGFPTETEEEAMLTMDFVKEMKWIHFPYINILRIYSATRMASFAMENGISYDAIVRSEDLAWHELPETLPFSKGFTLKYQTRFLKEYILSKERLLHVLPFQVKQFTEDELVQKYNSYLPVDIRTFSDLLRFAEIRQEELGEMRFLNDDDVSAPGLDLELKRNTTAVKPSPRALRVLLMDLNLYFSHETEMLYDLVDEPLGLIRLMTQLNLKFGSQVAGKIVKSRIDFNDYAELKTIVKEFEPDLIGIRTLTFYRDFFHKTAALIRQWGIDVPIIAGGPHATTNFKDVLQDRNIDLVVIGEGELTFEELTGAFIKNKGKLPGEALLREIDGLAFVPREERAQKRSAREILMLDEMGEKLAAEPGEDPGWTVRSSDMAYVIFTSGSSGKPKGVEIEHRNLSAYLRAFDKEFRLVETDAVIQQTGYSFDASVEEFYPVLLKGGRLVIPAKETILDIDLLVKFISKHSLTMITCSPLMLNQLNGRKGIESIRIFISGGDVLKGEYIGELLKTGAVYNTYGPTEGTVCATYYKCGDDVPSGVPIGKPITGWKVYILDKKKCLLPIGIAGELCIGGAGTARGYLKEPGLTKEKFVTNPHVPGERIYRSGDLARWLPDGSIEFLGRIDRQVKIRGFRIELREIENQLLRNDSIKEAVVIDRQDKEGEKYLAAYVVLKDSWAEGTDVPGLREFLSGSLPGYMVPAYFVQLENIPVTSQGKVDRRALPAPVVGVSLMTYIDKKTVKGVKVLPGKKSTLEDIFDADSEKDTPLSEEETRRIIYEFNRTDAAYPQDKTIHGLFEEQVEKEPGSSAAEEPAAGVKASYDELNKRANRLARLLREKGVGPDDIVGIMVERSLEMLIGIMAILKAGGAYMPIDRAFPPERKKYIIDGSRCKLVLVNKELTVPGYEDIIINLDDPALYKGEDHNLCPAVGARNLAQVLYTSGTTGNPKGVLIEHRSVINLIASVAALVDFSRKDNVLAITPLTFDLFAVETLLPLTLGPKVVIGGLDELLKTEAMASIIESAGISIFQGTPSALQNLVSNPQTARCLKGLRYVLSCGEVFPDALAEKVRGFTGAPIYNFYGPTETTMYSTVKDITQPGKITIGGPIANTGIYILGKSGLVQPTGQPGEICIGGHGVARGYLNRQFLTQEQFIENPFKEGDIIYKTGDMGKWLPNGEIEFIGRIDHQVKIGGIRMEPGEIESLLSSHDDITKAAVVVKTNPAGNDYLCAYVVSGKRLLEPAVRKYLAEKLPHYMIPSLFVQLEEMPLTTNRKIDRLLLQSLEAVVETGGYTAPRSYIEKKLAGIWAEVLDINKEKKNVLHKSIGINDNFFELGGHSLKAVTLTAKIHKEMEVDVPLAEIFKTPTIKGLSEYIKDCKPEKYAEIKSVEKKEYYALSSAQKRLFILQQIDFESTGYNMPSMIYLDREADMDRLERGFGQLIGRHNSLRTSLEIINENPVQRVHEQVEFEIEYFDLAADNTDEKVLQPAEIIHDSFVRPFDLSKAPLLRVGVIRTPESNILLLDTHHIISDGITQDVLAEEFRLLYEGKELPGLRLQYKDYAAWQNSTQQQQKMKEQEEYWTGCFPGEIPVLDLPTDYARPVVQSFEGHSLNFALSVSETQGIKRIVKNTGATLNMVLLSVYALLLSKLSGQEDIIIGVPVAARRHHDLERIVGMFVNTLALWIFPAGDKTYEEFLADVKVRTLAAYDNQEYQFEELVDKLAVRRDTGRNPVFDVVFNFINREEGEKEFPGADAAGGHEYENRSAKFDLTLRAVDSGKKIFFNLEYSIRLFKQETIERLVDYFKRIVSYITRDPGFKISDISITPAATREEKLKRFNEDVRESVVIEPIQVKLANSFRRYKDNIAVEYGNRRVTYRELAHRAACIEKAITAEKIKKGSFIGIYLTDRLDVVSALIGILNAGCVFVPLDTRLPLKRIEEMARTAGIRALFTGEVGTGTKLLPGIDTHFIIGDSFYNRVSAGAAGKAGKPRYHGQDRVYIYFTSGTSGKANALTGKNESLSQFIQWEIDTFQVGETSRVSQLAAVGFDAFLRNVLTPLCAGGTVCIPERSDLVMDGSALGEWLDEQSITLMHCVPSVFRMIHSGNLTGSKFHDLKYILLSGEQLNPNELKRWYRIFADRIQLVNCYGATETTIIKSYHFIRESDVQRSRVPVGRAMRGARMILADKNMNVCDRGIVGEIYIRTPYGTYGYLDAPRLNRERFIPNPFDRNGAESDIVYKTGDLGRELESGDIEVLGRIDRQVKIRGVRIELESIENVLLRHDNVDQAVVMSGQDEQGEDYLCAYVVNKKDEPAAKAKADVSQPRERISHLDDLPLPDRSLVNYESYTKYIGQSLIKNSISLLGSRGCPFKCAYCHKIWPKKQLSRSAENIFEELLLYYKTGFRRFVFLDDIFNLNVKNTTRFFEMIIAEGLDVQLCLNLRGDILTREYIDLMVKAGVIRTAFALETASPRLQKMIGKNLNLDRFKVNMEYIAESYPQVILEINTMHGFPTETEEEAMATLDFIKDLKWVHFPYINILKIYPNTDMEKLALEHGISPGAIARSTSLAYHELPETLPFDKTFTMKYQLELMSEYFLSKERLLHVLPYQLKVLSEDEIVQKYDSYLPVEIGSFDRLLEFAEITKEELGPQPLNSGEELTIPGLNEKLQEIFPAVPAAEDALKILLLDLSQYFSSGGANILYDVVEAPLGLMYLAAYLEKRYKEKVVVKIAKSRIDFDNYEELESLVAKYRPGLIGIRTLTYFKEFFHETASMIRRWQPAVPVLAGGPYATGDYETLLQDRNIDLAVLGEGEETLGQLVGVVIENGGKIPGKESLRKIPGTAFASREETGAISGDEAVTNVSRESSDLREYLTKELPIYMLPSYFVALEKIPLTPNGKIDRKALPRPRVTPADHYIAPKNEIEKKMVNIWASVLKADKGVIGMDANFFELGGHSLKATILTAKIHEEFNVKVPLARIFKHQTAAGLADYIKSARQEKYTAIKHVEKREYYELSSAQKRLYILQQMEVGGTGYNISGAVHWQEHLDMERLEHTFRELTRRHESLRTSFVPVNEEPVQQVHDAVDFAVEYYDVTGKNDTRDSGLKIQNTFVRGFDLSDAPLFRLGVIKTGGKNYTLLLDMHHIISDGTSHQVLAEEFRALYDGKEFPPLPLQYKDYTRWQNSGELREIIKKQEEYWLEEFSDAADLPVLELPADYPRPAVQSFAGNTLRFALTAEETGIIENIAKETDTTLYMVILSIYNVLLSKLSGQEEIITGAPVAARRHAQLQRIIGMFVNTLALRNRPVGDRTFKEFLKEVKTRTLQAFENQEYQFEDLVDKLSLSRDASRNPLFDVVFNLLNLGDYDGVNREMPEQKFNEQEQYVIEKGISKFDMTLTGTDMGDHLLFAVEYCTKIFKQETIERFITYFRKIISLLSESIHREIAGMEIISPEEKQRLLYDFNDTETGFPKDKTIHELFEEQVERTPGSAALIGSWLSAVGERKGTGKTQTVQLTYRELNKQSNRLAGHLRRRGVKPKAMVGLMVERSTAMISGILGILKAGGAYLPVKPGYPEERIRYMLEDGQVEILLTQGKFTKKYERDFEVMNLESDEIYIGSPENPERINSPGDLIYIIYTSGSTGKPKGVMVEHRNVSRRVVKEANYITIESTDILLQLSNYAFDGSVFDIFGALPNGAKLVMVGEEELLDVHKLSTLIQEEAITIFFVTTALFNVLVDIDVECFTGIKNILFGGERVSLEHVKKAFVYLEPGKLIHMYGPTETTVYATYHPIHSIDETSVTIPIGKPLSNTSVYIVDKDIKPVPLGVAGEIFIGGDGVSRGYLNDPELTADRFASDQLFEKSLAPGRAAGGANLYKTGDLARWLPNGNIEFLGRMDSQVKLRGFRIELGEIETELLNIEQVKEALTLVKEDRDGQKYIYAYIVAKKAQGNETIDFSEIKKELSKNIPDYMVPSYFMELEKMPLNPNGKIDKKALPEPKLSAGRDYIAPADELERKLAEVWSEVLNVEKKAIGMETNFFDLGGHSLKATILAAKIHKEMNIRVPLVEIFRTQTMTGLSEYIKNSGQDMSGAYVSIQPVEKREYYELSSSQKRLYVLQQITPESTVYNIPEAVYLHKDPDMDRVEKTFRQLIERHESLRTSFVPVNEEPVQRVHDHVEFEIENNDSFIRPFDLSKAPLLRVGLMRREGNHILLIDMHHIISDGTSHRVLTEEFNNIYEGDSPQQPGLQYKDYAAWQNSREQQERIKKQEEYWLEEFSDAGELPVLNLSTDYPRPVVQSFAGDNLDFTLDEKETEIIKRTADETGATLYMVILTIYNVLLSKLSGQEDIIIGAPVAARRRAEIQRVIGMFVNTLTLRNRPVGDSTFEEFLKEVKTRTLWAFENQEYQFEDLVNKLAITRDLSRNPIFDTAFNLLNQGAVPPPSEGTGNPVVDRIDEKVCFISKHRQAISKKVGRRQADRQSTAHDEKKKDFKRSIAKFDMTLTAVDLGENLYINFEYCTKLFKQETIERFINYFRNIISLLEVDVGQKISGMEIISKEEKERLLYNFNDTKTGYPKDKTVHELFEEQVERTPESAALVGRWLLPGGKRNGTGRTETVQLTYRELNKKANRLAGHLRRKSIKPKAVVGIMVERSTAMIRGILGILKAGGTYLPLKPGFPEERVRYMLADGQAGILLTQSKFTGKYERDIEVIDLESSEINMNPAENPGPVNSPKDLIYIIYTSGSTGKPKGVMVEHRNVSRVVKETNYITIKPADILLQLSNYAFDGSVFDIFGSLLNGAKLAMVGEEEPIDVNKLSALVQEEAITIFFVTTALFNVLVDTGVECFKGIKNILFGGERVSLEHVKKAFAYLEPGTLIHMYGPTETTVYASYHPIRSIDEIPATIPIGKPLSNTTVYMLDKYMKPVPMGVPGEIYIGGDSVSRGYLNDPELNAEKFAPGRDHPVAGDKLYKTGDLARWLPGGNIEFLGRMDGQVKLRGFRIELGEIETELLNIEQVKEALTLIKEDIDGQKYICAYIVAQKSQGHEAIDFSEIKKGLSKNLPDYMIPSYFMELEKLPLNPNGKIDKKALPEPAIAAVEKYIAPGDETEKKLVEIGAEVLRVDKKAISMDMDFFEIGGHSLSAAMLVSKINKEFDVKVPLAEVFRSPTFIELSEYVRSAEGDKNKHVPVEPVEKREYYRLSSAQTRLYIVQQLDLESTGYNIPGTIPLSKAPDTSRLEETFEKLIGRYESFRTSIEIVDDEPVQRISHDVDFAIEYYSPGSKESEVEKIIEDFVRPFDLSKPPLLRVGLLITRENNILLVDMHHIISDGTSHELLKEEYLSLYDGKKLPGLRLQYKDYAEWQNSRAQQQRLKKQEEYWLEEFPGELPILNLPADYARPAVQDFEGHFVGFTLARTEVEIIRNAAKKTGATLFMVLLSIYNILLAKLSGREDVIIGTPVAARRHADLQKIVGMIVNTLALRNFPVGEKTFAEFLKEVKSRTLEALENQEYQFEDLVERLSVNRDVSRNPVFDVMFNLLNRVEDSQASLADIEEGKYVYKKGKVKFDITLTAVDLNEFIYLTFGYWTKLFRKETIETFIRYFRRIIAALGENPEQKILDIEIISKGEKERLLHKFNDPDASIPADKTIRRLFEEQVEKTPGKIALVGQNAGEQHKTWAARRAVTYRQLNKQANRLARLLRGKGAAAGKIVGVMIESSPEMITGILAVLKAGGAFLPIEPGTPEQRKRYIVDDGCVTLILSREKYAAGPFAGCEVIDLTRKNSYTGRSENLEFADSIDDLVYAIYTSGTTGKPKAVLLENINLANYTAWFSKTVDLSMHDKTVLTSSFAFDLGYTSIFTSILNGGELHLIKKEDYLSAENLVNYMAANKITYIKVTPSLFTIVVNSEFFREEMLGRLRLVVLGGEEIKLDDIEKAHHLCKHMRIMNHYGPTETTIGVIARFVDFDNFEEYRNNPTIGKPVFNAKAFILDRHLKLLPMGVAGELYISGTCVARGYLGRPELTAEKFASAGPLFEKSGAKIFHEGQRPGSTVATQNLASQALTNHQSPLTLYRTGDLARRLPDGNIQFLGRADSQVKLRGFRIELGEIENRLSGHREIKEAAVIAKQDKQGQKYLCAYIVRAGSMEEMPPAGSLPVPILKEYLSRRLPDYMIPSYFVELEKIPLTPNGKVDRKALPDPEFAAGEDYMAPRNGIEKKLAKIWSGILNVDKDVIGTRSNFFELGGHSLKAAILISVIHKELDIKVPLVEIFKTPTITGLSEYIGRSGKDRFAAVEPVEEREYYRLSSAQKRLYILQQMEIESTAYNMPGMIYLDMEPGKERLEKTFEELIKRHESFRTSLRVLNEGPVQVIHDSVEFEIEYFTMEHGASTREIEAVIDNFIRPFDLGVPPFLRVALIAAGANNILLVDRHHIITDGVSRLLLEEEFDKIYNGEELSKLGLQYKDYAEWQNSEQQQARIKKQEEYWLERFRDKIPFLNLRYDFDRPPVKTYKGNRLYFHIEAGLYEKLNTLAVETGTTLYIVLLSAYYVLLFKYSNDKDIVVGSPVTGRSHADLDKIIGMFVNMLSIRNRPDEDKTFAEFLLEVKDSVIGAMENQDYQFEELVNALGLDRVMGRNPVFDVVFAMQNQFESLQNIDRERFENNPYRFRNVSSRFDLLFTPVEINGAIEMIVEYSVDLFKQSKIEKMFEHYIDILKQVVDEINIELKEIRLSHDFSLMTTNVLKGSDEGFGF
jgi:amino acid adenylation domain-containing protein